MNLLPTLAVYAKVIPRNVEGTSFAILTGCWNLFGNMQGPIGAAVNKYWVGCTATDLSKYWILVMISIGTTLLPLFFIWLLPSNKQIAVLQQSQAIEAEDTPSCCGDNEEKNTSGCNSTETSMTGKKNL